MLGVGILIPQEDQRSGGASNAPVLWTPLNDAGLVEWWNAQDTARMTFNGSNISFWNGEKGAHNFTQANPANQASYVSTINSLLVPSIVGAVLMPGDVFVQPGTYSFGTVFQPANSASGARILNADNGGGQRQAFYLFQDGGKPATLVFTNGGIFTADASSALVNGTSIVYSALNAGTSVVAATNGTNGTPVAMTGVPATATIGFDFGDGNAGLGLVGDIILSGTATVSIKQKIEGFLAWKYGLQGGLPVGSPYKSRPPYVSDP